MSELLLTETGSFTEKYELIACENSGRCITLLMTRNLGNIFKWKLTLVDNTISNNIDYCYAASKSGEISAETVEQAKSMVLTMSREWIESLKQNMEIE